MEAAGRMTDYTSPTSTNHGETVSSVERATILDVVRQGATLLGLVGPEPVQIVVAARLTDDSVNVVYRTEAGTLGERIVFATDLPNIQAIEAGAAFSFDGDSAAFKLAAEARRMVLSHLIRPADGPWHLGCGPVAAPVACRIRGDVAPPSVAVHPGRGSRGW